jgi:hypothetical protein
MNRLILVRTSNWLGDSSNPTISVRDCLGYLNGLLPLILSVNTGTCTASCTTLFVDAFASVGGHGVACDMLDTRIDTGLHGLLR